MKKIKNILKLICGFLLILIFILILSLIKIDYRPTIQNIEVHYLNDIYIKISLNRILFQRQICFLAYKIL